MNQKSSLMPVSIYYSLIYMSNGSLFSYIGLYYAGIHLSNWSIGILTTVSAVISLVGQPYWGIVSDRSKYKNTVLLICLLLATVTVWLVPLSGTVLWMLVLSTAVFYFFQCAINPLSDAMTLELAAAGSFSFSRVRTIGSLGYALMSAVAGWIFANHINRIFVIFFVLMLLSFAFSMSVPRVEGHQRGRNRVRLIEIFKNRKLVYIYAYAFVIESTLGFFFAFNAIYSKQVGISTNLIGLGIMIGSFSQFPFMIFFEKVYKRFGITQLLLISGIIHAVRWLLYATSLNSVSILFLWALHGGTYIVFYLCMAEYVNKHVVKELKASGQMMNSIVMSGISKVFGGLVGGACATTFGIQWTFAICAVVSLIAVIGFLVITRASSVFQTDVNALEG